ncbi:MAG: DUF4198 domain-containing protein [Pseudomonadota bacterium]
MPTSTLIRSIALVGCLFGQTQSVQAHEFWFTPITSPQAVGDTVTLRLEVGEFFTGEAAGFSVSSTRALRHYRTGQAPQDLQPLLPADAPEAEVALALHTPGTHLLAYDSTPQHITLEAARFHAYLHDEGLDFVKTQREQAGTASEPARERYRRHVKTLIAVGPIPQTVQALDPTYAQRAGQRLEITPLHNPLALAPGAALPIKILFDNQPLAGALVKAWHKHHGQLVMIRATTSAQGEVRFNLPYTGDWMVSVVHMIPAVDGDEEGVDWDSFWGNLTFHLPSKILQKQ